MTTEPTPCPVCLLAGGFHNRAVHGAHQVPEHLTWKGDEQAPWAVAHHDAVLALSAAVTPENEEKLQALTVGGKRLGPTGLVMLATAVAEDAETVLKGLSD
jgi:hypothetical protein